MFFIDSSDIKFETFLNYVFINVIHEIGSKNCNKIVDNHFKMESVRFMTIVMTLCMEYRRWVWIVNKVVNIKIFFKSLGETNVLATSERKNKLWFCKKMKGKE